MSAICTYLKSASYGNVRFCRRVGACDGEIRLWDLDMRKCVWRVYAHSGFVRGLSVAPDGNSFFSCGDKTVKQWELRVAEDTNEVRLRR